MYYAECDMWHITPSSQYVHKHGNYIVEQIKTQDKIMKHVTDASLSIYLSTSLSLIYICILEPPRKHNLKNRKTSHI